MVLSPLLGEEAETGQSIEDQGRGRFLDPPLRSLHLLWFCSCPRSLLHSSLEDLAFLPRGLLNILESSFMGRGFLTERRVTIRISTVASEIRYSPPTAGLCGAPGSSRRFPGRTLPAAAAICLGGPGSLLGKPQHLGRRSQANPVVGLIETSETEPQADAPAPGLRAERAV